MLSTPRSLGFVLAAILGAMLVPGCRPEDRPFQTPQPRLGVETEVAGRRSTD
jgi:hypothetical protein